MKKILNHLLLPRYFYDDDNLHHYFASSSSIIVKFSFLLEWILLTLMILVMECLYAHLVSINPKFSFLERTSGPLLWPQPERYLINQNYRPYHISTDMVMKIKMSDIELHQKKCDIIKHNLRKYRLLINDFIENIHRISSSKHQCYEQNSFQNDTQFLNEVLIFVDNPRCDMYPEFVDDDNLINNDESYHIEIKPGNGKAILYSKNLWGMIRGLETFSQLLYVRQHNVIDHIDCPQVLINVGHVWDQPRFRYRSMMIDTARHFIPISLILKNLDAMAYNKMNIFHWHLNDDQSFPFESEIFKNFSRLASYDSNHFYTKQDIMKVVEEARLRGIQVIIELDTPAHGRSLGKVFPEIMSRCNQVDQSQFHLASTMKRMSNIINPSSESTYRILKELMNEMRSLFPSNWIHLGMDDTTYECWSNDDEIQQFMKLNDLESFEKLEQYYLQRMVEMATKLRLKPIIWQDPFDKDLQIPPGTVIQVWKDHRLLNNNPHEWKHHVQKLLRQNYSIILSSCYFLNLIQYGQDWKAIYECDPHDFNGYSDQQKRKFVLGGEACLWTEYIDGANFLPITWPRASAVAERLWSQTTHTNLLLLDDDVNHRLDAQRCRMLRRGISTQPISTGFCEYFDWTSYHHHNRNLIIDVQANEKKLQQSEIVQRGTSTINGSTRIDMSEFASDNSSSSMIIDFLHMVPDRQVNESSVKRTNEHYYGGFVNNVLVDNGSFTVVGSQFINCVRNGLLILHYYFIYL